MKHRSILSLIIVIILCLGCVVVPIHASGSSCGGNHVYECVGNGTHYVTPNQYSCNWQQMVHCTHVCSCGATQIIISHDVPGAVYYGHTFSVSNRADGVYHICIYCYYETKVS